MSIFFPEFFKSITRYLKRYGKLCKIEKKGKLQLWDTLYVVENYLTDGARCLEAPDLAEALKTTAHPDCVEKKVVKVTWPYLEYVAERDYALLAGIGPDGVYLVENIDGAISCICKSNMDPTEFLRSIDVLQKWYTKIKIS
ncbi:MAG: hypothetical protein ACK4SY_08350 [Pyrobaculum sp.]